MTSEVLPSIRKHGMYVNKQTMEQMLTSPDFAIKTLEALNNERAEKEKLQKQSSIQSAKIEFIIRVLDIEEKIYSGVYAEILELSFSNRFVANKVYNFFKSLSERL